MHINSKEFEAAFELMEGLPTLERGGSQSVKDARAQLVPREGELAEMTPVYTIYGQWGVHRYYVLGSGEVVFSKYHAGPTGRQDAKDVGFRLW